MNPSVFCWIFEIQRGQGHFYMEDMFNFNRLQKVNCTVAFLRNALSLQPNVALCPLKNLYICHLPDRRQSFFASWDSHSSETLGNIILPQTWLCLTISLWMILKNKWLYRVQLFFLSAIGRLTDWPLILHNNPIVLTPGQVYDLSHGPRPQSGLVLLGIGVLLECLILEGILSLICEQGPYFYFR